MRISYKAQNQYLGTRHESFSSLSRIIQAANKHYGSTMVFDLKNTYRADGNLASVYAALSYMLSKSNNSLTIIPKKAISKKILLSRDLLGYRSSWEELLELTFWSGGTKVHAFDPHDYDKFSDYLFYDAFAPEWKGVLPVHIKRSVKSFLKELFQNASEHSKSASPIFISSSYRGKMLRFTIVDCGEGFLRQIMKVDDEVITEEQAIKWAMLGKSVKGPSGSSILELLGDYCIENEGELLIVSGCASVAYNNGGIFHFPLPAPFRGTIINLSVKVNRNLFSE